MKFCSPCRRRYTDAAQFCEKCGKPLTYQAPEAKKQGTPIGIVILTIIMVIIALMFILPQSCQLRGTVTVTPSVVSTKN